jgi:outer membrane protein assembly factor BamB
MMKRFFLAAAGFWVFAGSGYAADWPQYRADAARSGYISGELPGHMEQLWVHEPAHPPQPAWQGDDTRTPFDHVYHVIAAEGRVFFGSSADGGVHALDAESGAEQWGFYTGSPVRFPPAYHAGKVYAVSDDGHLYCLRADDGCLVWKRRGGPSDAMVLGNDRMVSRWPARGAATIHGDTVLYSAGIWPTEGIYLYALDAETGEIRWCNDSSGGIEMDQPHPTARAVSGVSIQGFPAIGNQWLFTPTGRAVPAGFLAADGAFAYFRLQDFGKRGGGDTVCMDNAHFNDGSAFDSETGDLVQSLMAHAFVVTPQQLLAIEKKRLRAWNRDGFFIEKATADRKGEPAIKKELSEPAWEMELPDAVKCAAAGAGDTLIFATPDGTITFADTGKKKINSTVSVQGKPRGLAVADRKLYVSTGTGAIYCFGKGRSAKKKPAKNTSKTSPLPEKAVHAASQILEKYGDTDGYCLDLQCGNGDLSIALARSSNLHIIALAGDRENLKALRTRLKEEDLLGMRINVFKLEEYLAMLPSYFADLVVAGAVLNSAPVPAEEAYEHLLRPWGGMACFSSGADLHVTVRGPLEDAGTWTHQYSTPANTCTSDELLVQAPISVLWFRDSDQPMPSRHGRGPAPLSYEGRLFVQGLHALRAVNAYNGKPLWEYSTPALLAAYDQEHLNGTAITGSNLCITENGLYVRIDQRCHRLDPATGKLLNEIAIPAEAGGADAVWGYLASQDGLLFGSTANTEHIVHWAYQKSEMDVLFSESNAFFVLDAVSGELKWVYEPHNSIRHNAIAIGGGRVYLIDRPLDPGDLLNAPEQVAARRGEEAPEEAAASGTPELLCFDAESGEILWRTKEDIYGTLLALSLEHDVLLMTTQFTRFRLPSETGGKMTAVRASDGKRLWNAPSDPRGKASRPLILGRTIYNEPGAWDLLTGERLDYELERSYGCGILAGCEHLFVYRSATLGFTDPAGNGATANFGGIRPGCWINAIPAGGLVLMPDATASCTCSYLIKANIAFIPE